MSDFVSLADWVRREGVNESTAYLYFRDGKIPGYCMLGNTRTKNFVDEDARYTDIVGYKKRKPKKEKELHPIIKKVIELKLRDPHSTYLDILAELSEKYKHDYTIHDIAIIVKKNRDLYRMLKKEHF